MFIFNRLAMPDHAIITTHELSESIKRVWSSRRASQGWN